MMRRKWLAGALAVGAFVLVVGGPCPSLASAAGDLNRAQCPNEELSGYSDALPDCRAYEMVTPPYKEGYQPLFQKYSSDGEQAFFGSFANLAGTAGDGESEPPAVYQESRRAGGWELAPLNPSSGLYATQRIVFAEPDSGASLWEMHTLEQPASVDELYARSASGLFSLVGPLTPPSQIEGGPSDIGSKANISPFGVSDVTGVYSHVILRSEDHLGRWEFDNTREEGGHSLYEYTGMDNAQPTLVGVFGKKGETALQGVGEGGLAGFECGIELGSAHSEAGSTYNAISQNGETIFFTPVLHQEDDCSEQAPSAVAPRVAEVWARVHGSVRVPLPAETIDVSARSPSECTGACEASMESGKFFEGASESGEKVFFTSAQQLLNNAHQDPDTEDNAAGEGGCAETTGEGGCNLYEYDFAAPAGHELKLIAGGAEVLGVARISEDGSRVYFVARGVLTPEANASGKHAQPGQPNLYVYNTDAEPLEADGFIATLDSETDGQDWRGLDLRPVQAVPADGRFLVFASGAPSLTADDSAKAHQLFEYDAQRGELVRISKAEGEEAGSAENGNAAESTIFPPFFRTFDEKWHDPTPNVAVSEQEGVPVVTVAFESRGRLSARATAAQQTPVTPRGCPSVYEYRSVGPIKNGGVYLISDGRDVQQDKGTRCGAGYSQMDASGDNILFRTGDPLVPGDTDGGQVDFYDARVDGGFAVPGGSGGCGGVEGCGVGSSSLGGGFAGGSLQSALQPAEGSAAAGAPKEAVVKRSARSESLMRALRACKTKHRARQRASCEARARRRYAAKPNERSSRRKGR